MQNEESYHMQFDHLHSDCLYDIVFNNTLQSIPPAGLWSSHQDPSLVSCKVSSMIIKQQTMIQSNNQVSAPERQQLSISHLTDF